MKLTTKVGVGWSFKYRFVVTWGVRILRGEQKWVCKCHVQYELSCVCVFLFKGSKHVYISLEAASIVVTLHSNTPSAILVHPMNMATSKGRKFDPHPHRFTLTLTHLRKKKQKNITIEPPPIKPPPKNVTYLQLPKKKSIPPLFWVPPPKTLFRFPLKNAAFFRGRPPWWFFPQP